MPGKVVSVSTDSFGDTIVRYRDPKFANFGDRMQEIELEHSRQKYGNLYEADAEDDEETEKQISEVEKIADDAQNSMFDLLRQQMPQLENLSLPGDQQKQLKDILSKLSSANSFDDLVDAFGDDDEDDESDDQEDDDPAILDICFEEPLKWSPPLEKRVKDFLKGWPKLRPSVLTAVFEAYRDQYDDIWEFMGGEPADKIILPDPTKPAVVEQLFRITAIELQDNDALVLAGTCNWDDEHGISVRIEDGKVTGVGQQGDF